MTADSPFPSSSTARAAPNLAQRFFKKPMALIGFAILLLLFFLAVAAPFIGKMPSAGQPVDPNFVFPNTINETTGMPHMPGGGFLFGTNTTGNDVWTLALYGARVSLTVALCAMVTSTLIGTTIGLIGGFAGGKTDRALTRFTEIVASLPTILLAITLAKVLPQFLPNFWLFKHFGANPDLGFFRVLLAIGLVTWTGIARAVRGQTLALKEREFVEAAHALGVPTGRILTRHLLPNVLPTVIVMATLAVANNILLEAGLSYLGLTDLSMPSWGSQIKDGQDFLTAAPWIVLVPGCAIVLAVTAFNLIGNALQEALETRR